MSSISRKKSTHIGKLCRSYGEEQKAPTYILPCSVVPSACEHGLGSNSIRREIKTALEKSGQTLWTTRPRISGLMALINHIASCQKLGQGKASDGVPCSNRLARDYVSKLRTAPAGVAREPLAALIRAGILEITTPAKLNAFSKASACYRIAQAYHRRKFTAVDDETTSCIKRKLEQSQARLENGLNRSWPFHAQLLRDLAAVTVASTQEAKETVDALVKGKDTKPCTTAILTAIVTRQHTVKVKPSGLIVTSLISCPRLLKPHLLIEGEPITLCDISSAHWMFLPRLVSNRIEYCRRRGDDENGLASLKIELGRLIELCSSGSFYQSTLPSTCTADDIKRRKKLLNVLLNSPCTKAAKNCVWQSLRRQFPLCIGIIDSIKRDEHRAISKQLQHFTANAVTAALLEMQAKGLPAIPDTDCLIVRERDREAACLAIGAAMHTETCGVCVTAGGIRYVPASFSQQTEASKSSFTASLEHIHVTPTTFPC